MVKNTIFIHGCGCCGINQTVQATAILGNIGGGFSNIKNCYVDTTLKNIGHYPDEIGDNYFLINDSSFSGDVIDGSGGERKTNHKPISDSVLAYLDLKGFTKKDSTTFHVVMFSAGGGSGSVIGPLLAKALVKRGIPTVMVVTGDDTTGNLSMNTMSTLSSIQSISKAIAKPLAMHYVSNTDNSAKTISEQIERTDAKISVFMAGLSLFMSGENFSLDNNDLCTLLDFTSITSIALRTGAYNLNIYPVTVDNSEHDYFIGRTLTNKDVSPDTGVDLLHWKFGTITNDNVLTVIGEKDLPLHLVLGSGEIVKEIDTLKKKVTALKKRVEEIKPDEIYIDEDSTESEDGLVF